MVERERVTKEMGRTPPYVDYHAFRVFLDEFKKQPTERIATSYLKGTTVVKSAHHTLLVTLRSLGLIDLEGKPTLVLAAVLKEGDELTMNLQKLVRQVYGGDLLVKVQQTSFARSDINQYFQEKYGLSRFTAAGCASFFVRLAKDAKLLSDKQLGAKRVKQKELLTFTRGNKLLAIKVELLQKLPDFKNGWQPAEVQVVLQQFEKLLSHLDE